MMLPVCEVLSGTELTLKYGSVVPLCYTCEHCNQVVRVTQCDGKTALTAIECVLNHLTSYAYPHVVCADYLKREVA